jgi:hypothetical protein
VPEVEPAAGLAEGSVPLMGAKLLPGDGEPLGRGETDGEAGGAVYLMVGGLLMASP